MLALVRWLEVTVPLTAITLIAGWRWYKREERRRIVSRHLPDQHESFAESFSGDNREKSSILGFLRLKQNDAASSITRQDTVHGRLNRV